MAHDPHAGHSGSRVDSATGTSTVGHEWDGIEELDTPLPRWWLLTFNACIVFALGYVVVYPGLPLLDRGTQGLWRWTSRGALAAEMQRDATKRAPLLARLATISPEALQAEPALLRAAVDGGRAAFRIHCATCHGAGAAGSLPGTQGGYPNLNDDDWLWGGDLAAIRATIAHGVRQPTEAETRMSQMPAFGRDGILKSAEIADLVSHVRHLARLEPASASAARGAGLFAANCAVCHGDNGMGNRTLGAPNLADAIWLYGGDRAALTTTISNARYGQMPAWGRQLDAGTVTMLAAYVHSLGGGEAAPAPTPAPTPGT